MPRIELSGCSVEIERRMVIRPEGEPVELTTREADLLQYLSARPQAAVSRDELLANVWGYHDAVVTRVCDNTVRRLREKVERDPSRPDHLITVHGTGYRFVPVQAAPEPTPLPSPVRPTLRLGDREIDLDRARVRGPGLEAELSGTEVALLQRLLAASGAVVSRQTLFRELWGPASASGRAVDHAVRRLRQKIEPAGEEPTFLLTSRGGYRLEVPPDADGSAPLGRGTVFGAIRDALERGEERWVLLIGPPGVGKTTLAQAVAARAPEARLVEAQGCRSAEEVIAAVGHALGVPPAGERIGRALASRGPLLLVLDNLEQAAEGLAPVLEGWLRHAPELRLLGTSRIRIGARRERVFEIEPLDLEAGVELFVRRARAASRSVHLQGEALQDVRLLVDRLGALPLAIELAAARTPLVSPRGLLERFGSADAPTGRLLDVLGALRSALEGSVGALAPPERRALLALALFVSPFTLDDAEALLGPDAIELVQALRDRSLVHTRREGHQIELAIFPVIREHAASERVALPDRGRALGRAHAAWMARLGAPEHLRSLSFRGQDDARALQRRAVEELAAASRLAVELDEPELAYACALGACWTWRMEGAHRAGSALGEAALGLGPAGARSAQWGRLAMRVGQLHHHEDMLPEAMRYYDLAEPTLSEPRDLAELHSMRAAIEILRRREEEMRRWYGLAAEQARLAGDRADAAHRVARVLASLGDLPGAERLLLDALTTCGPDMAQRFWVLTFLSRIYVPMGQLDEAWMRLEQALELIRALGFRSLLPAAYSDLSRLALRRGDFDGVARVTADGLAFAREMGLELDTATLLSYRGRAERLAGSLESSWTSLSAARQLFEESGDVFNLGNTEMVMAELALDRGDPTAALALAERGWERATQLGEPWNLACADLVCATAMCALGRTGEARTRAEQGLQGLLRHADPSDQLMGWCSLGMVAAAQGDSERMETCLAEAQALAATHPHGPRTEPFRALQRLRERAFRA